MSMVFRFTDKIAASRPLEILHKLTPACLTQLFRAFEPAMNISKQQLTVAGSPIHINGSTVSPSITAT
jgi:hypothetical protein